MILRNKLLILHLFIIRLVLFGMEVSFQGGDTQIKFMYDDTIKNISLIVSITGGNEPYSYVFDRDIDNSSNNIKHGSSNDNSIHLNSYRYDEPGQYTAEVMVKDSKGNSITTQLKINNFIPYLPEPVVAIHGYPGNSTDYKSDNYKNLFQYLRGSWNEDEKMMAGGYDLVCIASFCKSGTVALGQEFMDTRERAYYNYNLPIEDQGMQLYQDYFEIPDDGYNVFPDIIKHTGKWNRSFDIQELLFKYYDSATLRIKYNIYADIKPDNIKYDKFIISDTISIEKDNFLLHTRWLNLAKMMWRYHYIKKYGSKPEDHYGPNLELYNQQFPVDERIKTGILGPKVVILGASMGSLRARVYLQSDAYPRDVKRFISLAGPNEGAGLMEFNDIRDTTSNFYDPLRQKYSNPVYFNEFSQPFVSVINKFVDIYDTEDINIKLNSLLELYGFAKFEINYAPDVTIPLATGFFKNYPLHTSYNDTPDWMEALFPALDLPCLKELKSNSDFIKKYNNKTFPEDVDLVTISGIQICKENLFFANLQNNLDTHITGWINEIDKNIKDKIKSTYKQVNKFVWSKTMLKRDFKREILKFIPHNTYNYSIYHLFGNLINLKTGFYAESGKIIVDNGPDMKIKIIAAINGVTYFIKPEWTIGDGWVPYISQRFLNTPNIVPDENYDLMATSHGFDFGFYRNRLTLLKAITGKPSIILSSYDTTNNDYDEINSKNVEDNTYEKIIIKNKTLKGKINDYLLHCMTNDSPGLYLDRNYYNISKVNFPFMFETLEKSEHVPEGVDFRIKTIEELKNNWDYWANAKDMGFPVSINEKGKNLKEWPDYYNSSDFKELCELRGYSNVQSLIEFYNRYEDKNLFISWFFQQFWNVFKSPLFLYSTSIRGFVPIGIKLDSSGNFYIDFDKIKEIQLNTYNFNITTCENEKFKLMVCNPSGHLEVFPFEVEYYEDDAKLELDKEVPGRFDIFQILCKTN